MSLPGSKPSAPTPSNVPCPVPGPLPVLKRLRSPWMLLILLWVAPAWIAACKPPAMQPLAPTLPRSCLAKAPPVLPLVAGERSSHCPPSSAACLTNDGAVALAWWINATIAWQAEAVASCGPAPAAGESYPFDRQPRGSGSATAADAGAPSDASMGETMSQPKINRCGCSRCGDVLVSTHRHHWVQCKCGGVFTDGGNEYVRRGYSEGAEAIDLPDDASLADFLHVTGEP